MFNIYQISISTNLCNYELWINDFRIDKQNSGHPANYDLPINQWLKNGVNELKMVITPLHPDTNININAYANLKLLKSELAIDEMLINTHEIQSFNSYDLAEISKKLNGNLPAYTKSTVLNIGKIAWGKQLEDLPDLDIDYGFANKMYNQLYKMFETKSFNKIKDLISPKIQYYASAYDNPISSEIDTASLYIEDLLSKKLQTISFYGFMLRFYGNNKLFCLEDNDGDQPLFFTDDIDDAFVFYPVFFGQNNNDKTWQIFL